MSITWNVNEQECAIEIFNIAGDMTHMMVNENRVAHTPCVQNGHSDHILTINKLSCMQALNIYIRHQHLLHT